jgi:2'-5' RNA ligase
MKKRLFIAVKIVPEDSFLKPVFSVKSALEEESVKWIDTGNIHITLAFLGDTDENLIPVLDNMLREQCTGSGSFGIVLRGFGVFRNFRDPKVIWAGIDVADGLSELNRSITEGLKDAGFKTDDKPFSPHITIGRIRFIKDRERLRAVLGKYDNAEFQKVDVREVILYESILRQTGSIYNPLGIYKL